jgi:hypothetical protein
MKSLGGVLLHYVYCLYKKRKTPCQEQDTKGEHHVTAEAEIRLIQL